ncbi:intraflagellar transport protein 88 homolog [Symsagittifera roscoffensis]|uniref:intraflagellar transport protein 88 homolog n=1 Tax=Symsagittifera roscoffensis TaxID=84072 RepID=UPI00307B65D8
MAREQVKFMDDDENDFDLYDFDTNEQVGQQLREAVKTSYGKSSHGRVAASRAGKPPSLPGGSNNFGAVPPTSFGRMSTAQAAAEAAARPMTAVRAAGFSSAKENPLKMTSSGNQGPKLSEFNDTPEERVKMLEKKVMERLQQSYLAASDDFQKAQESAQMATREFDKLERERTTNLPESSQNVDLQFSVKLNKAILLQKTEKFEAAKQAYQEIIHSKNFLDPITKRFNVNIGNMLIKSRVYNDKEYKKAIDNTPQTHKLIKCKINMNRAIVLIKKRKYEDAADLLEQIFANKDTSYDIRAAYNLLMCRYMCGDRQGMKSAFERMLRIDLNLTPDDQYFKHDKTDTKWNELVDAIKGDRLYHYEKSKRDKADQLVVRSAKLIAPCIEPEFSQGFDWVADQMKTAEQYKHLYNEIQISKAISYVKMKKFNEAIDTLKEFAKKGSDIAGSASTNLAAIFFLQNDLQQAQKYATIAVELDPYNAQAFNNKGCVLYKEGQFSQAYQFFSQACKNDATCIEALYNMGLAAKSQGHLEEAKDRLEQLHSILRTNAEVEYQLAEIYESMGDTDMAKHWLEMVAVTSGRHDPGICVALGNILEEEDENEAFKMYNDAFKALPSSSGIIKWLGSYYIKMQVYEKAIMYFEKAAVAQPANVTWPHHIAKCYRRIGNYHRAFETYKLIHRRFPDNIECLECLVQLSNDLGLKKEHEEYSKQLKKAHKSIEIKEQRIASGSSRRGSGVGMHGMNSTAPAGGSAAAGRMLADNNTSFGLSDGTPSREGSGGSGRNIPRSHKRGGLASTLPPSGAGSFEDPALARLGSAGSTRGALPGSELSVHDADARINYQERPKTAAKKPMKQQDEFADEELGDDLLPE